MACLSAWRLLAVQAGPRSHSPYLEEGRMSSKVATERLWIPARMVRDPLERKRPVLAVLVTKTSALSRKVSAVLW